MTERERVLSILRHEQPDQVPWLADLSYWMGYLSMTKQIPAIYGTSWKENNMQQLHRDLGTGYYLQGFFPMQWNIKNIDISEVYEALP